MNKKLKNFAWMLSLVFFFAACASRSEKVAEIMEQLEAGEIPEDVTVYKLDTGASTLYWEGSKVVGAHDGTVDIKWGEGYVYDGQPLAGTVVIDMTRIVVLDIEDPSVNARLQTHLETDDFFSVEAHPTATLDMVRMEAREAAGLDEPNYTVFANLTIKGVTHGIVFPARIQLAGEEITASADFDIDRTRWGIRYGSGRFFENLGDNMINDLFNIRFEVVGRQVE